MQKPKMADVVANLVFSAYPKISEVKKCSIKSLTLGVPVRIIWCCCRLSYPVHLTQI